MIDIAAPALALSTACILAVALGDPKRRRSARLSGNGHRPAQRRLLTVCALLPGLFCIGHGDPSAFLIWLGGCAVAGWLIAIAFSRAAASCRRNG
ncbi:hypothetical protein WG907_05765 [Sphingobium sp. AN558]|uniref:hypothetical protein n=1 Tax=Sphingobium sp. AN558 TaxID=3133442 RepID=UPI0030C3A7D1